MKQVIKLETILAKLQSTFGTMITPLLTTDYIQGDGPTIDMDIVSTDIESVGASFGQDPPVSGPREATHNIGFPLRSGGVADTPGDWAKYLQCCGFKESVASHKYTYAKALSSEDWKDLTIWGYTGGQGTNKSLISVLSNLIFSAKITLDFNAAYGKIDFTGKGNYHALPTLATQQVATRKSLITPNLLGFEGTLFDDVQIVPITLVVDIANEITVCLDPKATNGGGKGVSLFSDMKIKYEAKYYVDTAIAKKPHADLVAETQRLIDIAWGTVPNKFNLIDAAVALKSVKSSDQNGVKTYDVSAVSIGNGMTLSVDTTSA
jgi:hypothetical protein